MEIVRLIIDSAITYLSYDFIIFGYRISLMSIILGFALLGLLWRSIFRLFK